MRAMDMGLPDGWLEDPATFIRVRGTSKIDRNLRVARGNIRFDRYTWYFNPVDRRPFGPTTASPTYYRNAIDDLRAYNARLRNCDATFDARADTLLRFLDGIAKDIGSRPAVIKERAEQYGSGRFDTRADDIFMAAIRLLRDCESDRRGFPRGNQVARNR